MSPGARLEAVRRLMWLGAGLLLWGLAIFAKLVSLQIIHHNHYLERAQKQQEHAIAVAAPRGAIFDRNGATLAMSVPVESVAVNPRLVPDKMVAAEVLAPVMGLDTKQVYEAIVDAANRHRGFLFIKHKLTSEESERLHSLRADWILFQQENGRVYPNKAVAAHIIGSVYQGDKGAEGVERAVDTALAGTPGSATVVTDVKRRGIDYWVNNPATPGKTLKLTVDERIQFVAERELAAQVELKRGRSGTVIVMNPYTGDILAMANYPTFDANKPPATDAERRAHFNLGAQVPFEPGSIFKVLTLSTALETTRVRPETPIFCHNGFLKLPGRVVHEAHGGYGMLTMAQVLEKSSNIGAIEIGSHIGREKFYEYLDRFGFGQRTGLPLPVESPGILRKLSRWGTTSLASVSIGQEVGATSLQLIRACAAVANGGLLVKPKLVLEVDGKPVASESPRRVLQPETTVTMRAMMEGVVLRGTGKNYIKLNGWTAGGKTGTAQIFEHAHYTHLYNASFMGFAPVTNPALVAIVTINGTAGNAGMGGPTAGPVWTKVMNDALRLYDVPKDLPETPLVSPEKSQKPNEFNEVPEIEGDSGPNVLEDEPEAMPSPWETRAAAAAPLANIIEAPTVKVADTVQAPQPVYTGPTAPDFRGKPMRTVVREAYAMGLVIKPEGSGVAQAQSPAPGSPVQAGDTVRVLFGK